jgi:hypothetical protein
MNTVAPPRIQKLRHPDFGPEASPGEIEDVAQQGIDRLRQVAAHTGDPWSTEEADRLASLLDDCRARAFAPFYAPSSVGRASPPGPITVHSGTEVFDATGFRDLLHLAKRLRPSRRRSTGRAPRASTNSRNRGSRRCRSATRAGPGDDDSGSDDPPGETEPPVGREQAERRCIAVDCNRPIGHLAPQARYCDDACRMRDNRARAEREELAAGSNPGLLRQYFEGEPGEDGKWAGLADLIYANRGPGVNLEDSQEVAHHRHDHLRGVLA